MAGLSQSAANSQGRATAACGLLLKYFVTNFVVLSLPAAASLHPSFTSSIQILLFSLGGLVFSLLGVFLPCPVFHNFSPTAGRARYVGDWCIIL